MCWAMFSCGQDVHFNVPKSEMQSIQKLQLQCTQRKQRPVGQEQWHPLAHEPCALLRPVTTGRVLNRTKKAAEEDECSYKAGTLKVTMLSLLTKRRSRYLHARLDCVWCCRPPDLDRAFAVMHFDFILVIQVVPLR